MKKKLKFIFPSLALVLAVSAVFATNNLDNKNEDTWIIVSDMNHLPCTEVGVCSGTGNICKLVTGVTMYERTGPTSCALFAYGEFVPF